jgi:predicted O-methyltransferase YrrM
MRLNSILQSHVGIVGASFVTFAAAMVLMSFLPKAIGLNLVVGGAVGLLVGCVLLLVFLRRSIRQHHKETLAAGVSQTQHIVAANHAASLLTRRFPECFMPVTSYSMSPVNLLALVGILDQFRPALVVELGSGISTLVVGTWMRENGGRLISIDHDEGWASVCRSSIHRQGLDGIVSLYVAPLGSGTGSSERPWYQIPSDAWERMTGVDLLVIDGPPAKVDVLARTPAANRLGKRLSPNGVIFVDDAARVGEQAVIESWRDVSPRASVRMVASVTGCAVIELSGARERAEETVGKSASAVEIGRTLS